MYLLTETRLPILALCTMNESGGFSVKTVQTIGLFVDKGIVLRNKLPADFRRNDVLVDAGSWIRHLHVHKIPASLEYNLGDDSR